MTTTSWEPCPECGATTRHDGGVCYRDERHPSVPPVSEREEIR